VGRPRADAEPTPTQPRVLSDNSEENLSKCTGLVRIEDIQTGLIYTAICEKDIGRPEHEHQIEYIILEGQKVARTVAGGLANIFPTESVMRRKIQAAQSRRKTKPIQGTLLEQAGVEQPQAEWFKKLLQKAGQITSELERLSPMGDEPRLPHYGKRGTKEHDQAKARKEAWLKERHATLRELQRKIMGGGPESVGDRPDIYGDQQPAPF